MRKVTLVLLLAVVNNSAIAAASDVRSATTLILIAMLCGVGCAVGLAYLLGGNVKGITPVATGRRWMNVGVASYAALTLTKFFTIVFGGPGDPGHALAMALLGTIMVGGIAFAMGALVAHFRGGAASQNSQIQRVSGLKQKTIMGVVVVIALVFGVYQSVQPSDYSACILKELPGTENDAVALAKANKCKQQFGIRPAEQGADVPAATDESRDCLIEHGSSTTNQRAAYIIGRACLFKFGAKPAKNVFDQFDPNPVANQEIAQAINTNWDNGLISPPSKIANDKSKAYDINGARADGHTDTQIAEYLAKKFSYDISGARKDGYTDTQIAEHLVIQPQSAHAAQEVSGLEINYSHLFKKDTATADSWLSQTPNSIRQLVVSMDIFVAQPSNGLSEVMLMKVRYVPTLNGSIDGAAAEAAQRIAALEGIKSFQKQIVPLSISGFNARQVSITADRWGGKMGGEFLIIYNRNTNVMWQMQLMFAKKKGINPLASLNIDEERHYARSLLSSIRIVP